MEAQIVVWIVLHQDKVLLIQRAKKEDDLERTFPSGTVEDADQSEGNAVVREIYEETGIVAKAQKLLWERIHPANGKHLSYRACEYISGDIHTTPNEEIANVMRVEKNQITNYIKTDIFSAVQNYMTKDHTLPSRPFTFPAWAETLSAVMRGDPVLYPSVLFLHGAGKSSKERNAYIAGFLSEKWIGSMWFDFSGHGESTGTMDSSSLEKRVQEVDAAWEYLPYDKKMTVVASSMSGHIALSLLKNHEIGTLILFCPAVYSDAAYTLKFDEWFTDEIRKPDSRKNSVVFDFLKGYTGKLLIIIGEHDTVIPAWVIEKIKECTAKVSQKELMIVPGAPHLIHGWLAEHPEEQEKVLAKVYEYVR